MTEPNPFAQFFNHAESVGPILVDDTDDGSIFAAAINEQFQIAMGELAEQVPDDDEEAANTMMAEAVQSLMISSFQAGALFQQAVDPDPFFGEQDANALNMVIKPEDASALTAALFGNGALLRLVVDRGQN